MCRGLHCLFLLRSLCSQYLVRLRTSTKQTINKVTEEVLLSDGRKHLRGQVTAGQVGVVAGVLHFTAHNVVAVVTLRDLILGVDTDLEGARKKDIGIFHSF